MRKVLLWFLGVVATLLLTQISHAYPQMINLGYGSCMSCHYNPFGGGPLTDYGRTVAATAVSDRVLFGRSATEEEVAERSGFLRQKPLNDWLRPALNYRGLFMNQKTKDEKESAYIIMDLSAGLVLKFLEDDKLILVGNIGYAPPPKALKDSPDEPKKYRTREHYVGYRISKHWGVYAGLMDKVYGLRIPDHIAFSRIFPQTTMNDQTHGAVLHGMFKTFEFGLHGFAGNLVQDKDLRQQGLSGTAEYSLAKETRVGASFIYSSSAYLALDAFSLHTRTGLGKNGSLIAEIGHTKKYAFKSEFEQKSAYFFSQYFHRWRQGLYSLLTAEAGMVDEEADLVSYKFGPGVQYYHLGGIELRTDLLSLRTYDGSEFVSETWQLLSQVHLWL